MAGLRTRAPLLWRVFGANALLFLLVAAALLWSPVTISYPIKLYQAAIVVAGLVVVMVVDGVLLRRVFEPLEQITRRMADVDLLRPGQRLPPANSRELAQLVASFNQMLDRLEHERMASGRRALEAQESERLRIAQELHDEVVQGLTGVLLWLSSLRETVPGDRRGELAELQEVVRRMLEEVRRIARELRPQLLDDLGLRSALAELATEFGRRTGVHVNRVFDEPLLTLTPERELALYRVAQEGLTNVARHAEARNVELSLTTRADSVILRVADDGEGMADGQLDGHGGLRGMRERAVFVGGALTIGSGPSGGVEITLAVPATSTP